jgi:hypothetical protein
MFKDAIRCTHNGTGGSGTLTLAATAGWPQPSSWFGSSGTIIVYYEIFEGTDSTFAALNQYERGIGSLVLSTGVLTRSIVRATIGSTGTCNDKTPAALTITNTAANVRISLGGSVDTNMGALPIVQNAGGSGFSGSSLGYQAFNTRQRWDGTLGTVTLSAGLKLWVPFEFRGGLITNVAVYCSTLHASAALRMGMYDWDIDGLPGNLLQEFTSSAQIALTATGLQSVAAASKMCPPPGWYFMCLQSNDSTAAINTLATFCASGLGATTGQREIEYYNKSGSYGALPSTGDKTCSALVSTSTGGQPWIGFN